MLRCPRKPSGGTVDTQIKTPPIMNNPNNIDKYPNIPFGQFQALINRCEKMDYSEYCESEIDKGEIPMAYEVWMELESLNAQIVARAQDIFLAKLTKKKSRKEVCSVLNLEFDRELGECEIYYRVIDLNVSPQSDESRDGYTIEFVYRNGKQIDITGRQEQHILDYLNETDPLNVFTKRA